MLRTSTFAHHVVRTALPNLFCMGCKMNDDSCLDCSDIPCSGCGYTQGDCHCTPEQVELVNHSLQHTQHKICPTCDGEGEFFSVLWDKTISCIRCGGSGKLRASA